MRDDWAAALAGFAVAWYGRDHWPELDALLAMLGWR